LNYSICETFSRVIILNKQKKSIKCIRLAQPTPTPCKELRHKPTPPLVTSPFIPFLLAGRTRAGASDFFFLFLFFGNSYGWRGNENTVKTPIAHKHFADYFYFLIGN